jgi:hypothetical protein
VKRKFTFEVDPAEIVAAHDDDQREVRDLILERAREAYRQREIEFPVDYAMQMAMSMARNDPEAAFTTLADWSKRRLGMTMAPEEVKNTPPARMKERLLNASREASKSDRLTRSIEEALAKPDDESLDRYLKDTFGSGITERMRYLEPAERADAVRARVETLGRPEMLQFEQMVLIETYDQAWKEHLYSMDQLRDTIGFRAISQQDPKIAYKRGGSGDVPGRHEGDPRAGHGHHLQGPSGPASPDGCPHASRRPPARWPRREPPSPPAPPARPPPTLPPRPPRPDRPPWATSWARPSPGPGFNFGPPTARPASPTPPPTPQAPTAPPSDQTPPGAS